MNMNLAHMQGNYQHPHLLMLSQVGKHCTMMNPVYLHTNQLHIASTLTTHLCWHTDQVDKACKVVKKN